MVIWELLDLAQHMPYWEAEDDNILTLEIVEGTRRLSKPPDGDEEIWEVAERCLSRSPDARPDFRDLSLEMQQRWRHHSASGLHAPTHQRQAVMDLSDLARASAEPDSAEGEQPRGAAAPVVLQLGLELDLGLEENPSEVFGTASTLAGRDPAQARVLATPAVSPARIAAVMRDESLSASEKQRRAQVWVRLLLGAQQPRSGQTLRVLSRGSGREGKEREGGEGSCGQLVCLCLCVCVCALEPEGNCICVSASASVS